MKRSQVEEQVRKELWEKFWPEKSEKTVRSYLGGLSANGAVTKAARQAGVLPDTEEALITLHDPDTVAAVAAWWDAAGKGELGGNKTAAAGMNKWLALYAQGKPKAAAKAPRRSRLRPPPYKLRLRTLLDGFVEELAGEEGREGEREILLQILTGDYDLYFETEAYREAMREHTQEFRALRTKILDRLDTDRRGLADEFLSNYDLPRLRRALHAALYGTMGRCGGDILLDMTARRLPLADSVLTRLDALDAALRGAGQPQEVLERFFDLLGQVLSDCDPAALKQGRGEPEFGRCPLLQNWLDAGPLGPEALAVLPGLTLPGLSEEGLRLRLLHSMLACAKPVGSRPSRKGLETAREWTGKAMVYLQLHWDELQTTLQQSGPWWDAVPEAYLEGHGDGFDRCLLWAGLLVQRAELELKPDDENESAPRRGYRMMDAQESLRKAELILRERVETGLAGEEAVFGRRTLSELWVRIYLSRAESYLRLARQEQEENCLGDAVTLYLTPARDALTAARDRLGDVPGGELHKRFTKLRDACAQDFFDQSSPVVARMQTRQGDDEADYLAEYAAWQTDLGPSKRAPQVRHSFTALDQKRLRSAEQFDTVYCGGFDSVQGGDVGHKEAIELLFFQMLASGKVCLLQMNQIVDNRAMLSLMPNPGFRQACREGSVTLSCYGGVDSPALYLYNNLKNPNFKFSSTGLFTLPDGADADALESSMRGAMMRYLESGDRGALKRAAGCMRDEVEFLVESYRILFECFQPADLLRFHQNEGRRMPPGRMPTAVQDLDTVIARRLDSLAAEAAHLGQTDRANSLDALRQYAKRWGGLNNRSGYDATIARAAEAAATAEERLMLAKFRKLVDQCYFLSNGRRSCSTVLLTETDPDLVLAADPSPDRLGKQNSLNRILKQKTRYADDSNLTWRDLCEIALIVRKIDAADARRSEQERAALKMRDTGCGFTVLGRDTLATELTPKTSEGKNVAITPADGGELLEVNCGE